MEKKYEIDQAIAQELIDLPIDSLRAPHFDIFEKWFYQNEDGPLVDIRQFQKNYQGLTRDLDSFLLVELPFPAGKPFRIPDMNSSDYKKRLARLGELEYASRERCFCKEKIPGEWQGTRTRCRSCGRWLYRDATPVRITPDLMLGERIDVLEKRISVLEAIQKKK
jgi:hypothetical protein